MKLFQIVFLLFFSAGLINAQASKEQYIKEAAVAMTANDYHGAISYYTEALAKDDRNPELLYALAQAEISQHAYGPAERHLSVLIDTLGSNEYPEAFMQLADLKRSTGDYTEAKRRYELFISEQDENSKLAMRAKKNLAAAEWALDNSETNEKIQVDHLDSGTNSPYSEHAPFVLDNEIYYAALKFEYSDDERKPKRKISKIVGGQSTIDWNNQSDFFNAADRLTSNVSISKSGKYMVYSSCQYLGETSNLGCELYLRTLDSEGNWGQSVRLPEPINQVGTSSTQASFGSESKGKTKLYFSSNRASSGVYNIYKTSFNESLDFDAPAALKGVNTSGNEMSPYYNHDTGELYFSSDSHLGYGGFDVFKTDEQFKTVENLGLPINSSYNDLFYTQIKTDETDQYYLSSNRPGSYFLESKFETCCYDLYAIKSEEKVFKLKTSSFDLASKNPLYGTRVAIYTSVDDNLVEESYDPSTHSYDFNIAPNRTYLIKANKAGFKELEMTLTSESLMAAIEDGSLEKMLYLEAVPVDFIVETFKLEDKMALIGSTIQLLNLDDKTVKEIVVTNANANDFTFNLIPGMWYQITASKGGFHDEIVNVFVDPNNLDEGDKNKDVYLRKVTMIESLAQMIPLRLFYENDYPNPRSNSRTTTSKYSQTYAPYMAKRSEYLNKYSGLFSGEEKNRARAEMNAFFDNEVKVGNDGLNYFMETMLKILSKGKSINIYLRGYASPISRSEYNNNLAARRIDAVNNEITQFQNGVLNQYINNGMLKITIRSFGEGTAPSNISDDPNKREQSVNSPEASRERRVEIDEIVEIK